MLLQGSQIAFDIPDEILVLILEYLLQLRDERPPLDVRMVSRQFYRWEMDTLFSCLLRAQTDACNSMEPLSFRIMLSAELRKAVASLTAPGDEWKSPITGCSLKDIIAGSLRHFGATDLGIIRQETLESSLMPLCGKVRTMRLYNPTSRLNGLLAALCTQHQEEPQLRRLAISIEIGEMFQFSKPVFDVLGRSLTHIELDISPGTPATPLPLPALTHSLLYVPPDSYIEATGDDPETLDILPRLVEDVAWFRLSPKLAYFVLVFEQIGEWSYSQFLPRREDAETILKMTKPSVVLGHFEDFLDDEHYSNIPTHLVLQNVSRYFWDMTLNKYLRGEDIWDKVEREVKARGRNRVTGQEQA